MKLTQDNLAKCRMRKHTESAAYAREEALASQPDLRHLKSLFL
jgi:hypothetical protein